MKTQQQITPLCSFATSNELGVHFRVNVTVHSNKQSSLHPPPSGVSFVNAQSPPRQNYRARRISPFSDWRRNNLFLLRLIWCCMQSLWFFPRYSRRLNKNLYVLLCFQKRILILILSKRILILRLHFTF